MTTIETVAKELDYSQSTLSHSTPGYVKLQSISNLTSFNFGSTSTQLVSYLIPGNRPINLSKSRLCWTLAFPQQGASKYGYLAGNALNQISRIVLTSTSTNTVLADIINCGKLYNGLNPYFEEWSELNSKGNTPGTTSTTAIPTMYTSAANAEVARIENISRNNSLSDSSVRNTTPYSAYLGYRKVFVSTAADTANYMSYSIALDSFDWSIFDLNKMLYFGENLQLDVYYQGSASFAYLGASATDPSNGAGAAIGTFAASNCYMSLMIEQNPDVQNALVSKVQQSGLQLKIPYIYNAKYNLTGTSHSFTLNISRSLGESLAFVAIIPYNSSETGQYATDHEWAGFMNSSVYTAANINTYLNGTPILSSANIDLMNSDSFFYQKPNLDKSCIISIGEYYTKFAWIDSWLGNSLCKASRNTADGLPLSATNLQYQYQLNAVGASATINYYVYYVTFKNLIISPSGIQIM